MRNWARGFSSWLIAFTLVMASAGQNAGAWNLWPSAGDQVPCTDYLAETINDMVQDRDLRSLYKSFGSDFWNAVFSAKTWVDFGAGDQAAAAMDYLNRGGRARVTAVSINFTQRAKLRDGLNAVEGYYENIDKTRIPSTFDVGTDEMGILTYTKHLGEFLTDVTGRMHPGSKYFVRTYDRGSTKIRVKTRTGTEDLTLFDWLARQKNVSVIDLGNREKDLYCRFVLSVKGRVRLPKLKEIEYKAAIPPIRIYQEQ